MVLDDDQGWPELSSPDAHSAKYGIGYAVGQAEGQAARFRRVSPLGEKEGS